MYFTVPKPNVSGANEYGHETNREHNTGGQHRALSGAEMLTNGPHTLENAPNVPDEYISGVQGGVNYAAPRKNTIIPRFFRFNRWNDNQADHGTEFQQARNLYQQMQGSVYRMPIGSQPVPFYGQVANPYARIGMHENGFAELSATERVAQNIATYNIPLSPRRDVRDR